MFNTTEQDLDREEQKWKKRKIILDRKKKLNDEKSTYRHTMSTTKFLMAFLFANFTILEIFVGYITLRSFTLAEVIGYNPDLTPLVTLISIVIAEVMGFFVYSIKAKAENCKGGIKYETVMKELNNNNNNNNVDNIDIEEINYKVTPDTGGIKTGI